MKKIIKTVNDDEKVIKSEKHAQVLIFKYYNKEKKQRSQFLRTKK